ncbi:MAG: M24 family metallopeptidase [Saprospiraceae bacterium]|nr:M24 family metallopeptidase [Saprospiraceae bacterium]
MRKELLIALFFLLVMIPIRAQDGLSVILPERQRAQIVDEILEDRLDNLLPQLMRREKIQMWVIISREYNEDPVMKTMLPSTWLSARRRTIMVFFDPGGAEPLEKIAIARYDVGRLLQGSWNIDVYPDQWDALTQIIRDRNPVNIAINQSQYFGLADGMVHTEYVSLMEHLPAEYYDRVVSAEKLAIAWLETRTQKELDIYPMICHLSHQILQEGLSEQVIHPGITTTDDVVWWLRQRVTELGLDTWFHPTVDVQRADNEKFDHLRTFSKRPERQVILPGDLLHVDFGITYLRLNSDQQQHFYVLKPGETEVPEALRLAFRNASRLQEILTGQFATGQSGNEILSAALKQAEVEGIHGAIYSHPIGNHGHAAGPAIGMWDNQARVTGTGDYPLHDNTAFSIELNAATEVPEWGKIVRIMLEEDGYYQSGTFTYLDGRQLEILTIPRQANR